MAAQEKLAAVEVCAVGVGGGSVTGSPLPSIPPVIPSLHSTVVTGSTGERESVALAKKKSNGHARTSFSSVQRFMGDADPGVCTFAKWTRSME